MDKENAIATPPRKVGVRVIHRTMDIGIGEINCVDPESDSHIWVLWMSGGFSYTDVSELIEIKPAIQKVLGLDKGQWASALYRRLSIVLVAIISIRLVIGYVQPIDWIVIAFLWVVVVLMASRLPSNYKRLKSS